MRNGAGDRLEQEIVWYDTGDVYFPYEAHVEGKRLRLRLNDFPDEPLYTLMVDDVEWVYFDDWPAKWHKAAG